MTGEQLILGAVSDVVIVCPRVEGHRLSYVRLLVSHARRDGRSVLVVLPPGSAASPEFETHLAGRRLDFDVREIQSFDPASVQALIDEASGGLLVFPDGDEVVRLLAQRKLRAHGAKLSVLMMRPRGQASSPVRRTVASAAKAMMRWAARGQRGVQVYSLAPSTARSLTRNEVGDPIDFHPVMSEVRALRAAWNTGSPSEASWFGIVGAITARKNIDLVAEALSTVPAHTGLVIAGAAEVDEEVISDWVAPMIKAGRPVVRMNHRLTDTELDNVVAAIDVAVVAHSNDGPSGIMGKAAAAGKYVLAAGAPTLRREILKSPELGVWAKLTSTSLATAATKVVRLSPRTSMDEQTIGGFFCSRLLREQ